MAMAEIHSGRQALSLLDSHEGSLLRYLRIQIHLAPILAGI